MSRMIPPIMDQCGIAEDGFSGGIARRISPRSTRHIVGCYGPDSAMLYAAPYPTHGESSEHRG